MAVCSEIHTKHINTLCGQNAELLNVEPGGRKIHHSALDSLRKNPSSLPTQDLQRNTPNAICLFFSEVTFKCRRSQSAG